MEKLSIYGLDKYIQHFVNQNFNATDEIGRVLSVKGSQYEIITSQGIHSAELLGKLLFTANKWEQPKVGDWVRYLNYDSVLIISEVLPRFNELYRKVAGREIYKQVIVTNVDMAVVIQGLDHDFNLSRLERYLVQLATCEIPAIVVLNKSDLVEDKSCYVQEINKLQRNIPVFFCSVNTGEGLEEIREKVFLPEKTAVLIGSSGVGKSSLLNILACEHRATREISRSTGKGKHTTTTRDMFLLDNGAIVIDTPGMREFGVGYSDETSFEQQYPAISKLAKECRFGDCNHINEAGCNVIRAYQQGELEAVVYESFIKLQKEQKCFQLSSQDKKRAGKQFGKMAREAQEYRKKYKF